MSDPQLHLFTDAWLGDAALQLCHEGTRGGWINILCYLHDAPVRGTITTTEDQLRMLANMSQDGWKRFLAEQSVNRFCDFARNGDGTVTISNRRMLKDTARREASKETSRKHREKVTGDVQVTPKKAPSLIDNSESESKSIPILKKETPFYKSKKGKKLRGLSLDEFKTFWAAYGYPRGRAGAIDPWINLIGNGMEIDLGLCEKIHAGARAENSGRSDLIELGSTPIYAQGWLTARRWEDLEPVRKPTPVKKEPPRTAEEIAESEAARKKTFDEYFNRGDQP